MVAYALPARFFAGLYPEPPFPTPARVGTYAQTTIASVASHFSSSIEVLPTKTGKVAGTGFWERDFKNSLIVNPKHIDLGFITGESSHAIEIWSTFETPLPLNRIVKQKDNGLTLDGATAGDSLAAYGGHWDYTLHVSRNVDFNVDALFDWQFGGARASVSVEGTRIVLWHFRPTYPVQQSWAFSTAIIETFDGEQRLKNSQYPIQRLSYRHQDPAPELSRALATFSGGGRYPIALPHWLESTSNINANKGSNTLELSTNNKSYFVGGYVLIYQSDLHFEVHQIASVSPTQIGLEKPLSIAFQNAQVMPTSYGISKNGLKSTRQGAQMSSSIEFTDINPPHFSAGDWTTFPWLERHLGLPVLTQRLGKNAGVADRIQFNITEKTTESGIVQHLANQSYSRRTAKVELIAQGQTQIQQLKQFLWHLNGRLNALWWPTFHNEIRLADSCSRNRLKIHNLNFESYINGGELRLVWDDGTVYVHAKSQGLEESGHEILELNTTNTTPVEPDALISSALLVKMRASTDNVSMVYHKDRLTVSLNLVEIPHGSD